MFHFKTELVQLLVYWKPYVSNYKTLPKKKKELLPSTPNLYLLKSKHIKQWILYGWLYSEISSLCFFFRSLTVFVTQRNLEPFLQTMGEHVSTALWTQWSMSTNEFARLDIKIGKNVQNLSESLVGNHPFDKCNIIATTVEKTALSESIRK